MRVSCCARAQSAHAPTRYQNSSAYDGLQIELSTEHLDRRIAAKRTHLRYQVLVSICANSACSSGLRDLLLSGFPVKHNGRKITSQFLFRPPCNPAGSTEKTGPPHQPRQAPRPKTPCGPKTDCCTTPRGSWRSRNSITDYVNAVSSNLVSFMY